MVKNKMRAALRAALRGMGRNREQVAAYLAKRRAQGYRHNCFHCPIANYLRQVLPVDVEYQITVGFSYASVGDAIVDLTKAQMDFVDAFDLGLYPKLVAGRYSK